MSILDKIFGDPNEKTIKSLKPIIEKINELEEKYANFSNEQLAEETTRLKNGYSEIYNKNKNEEDGKKYLEVILPEAFAVIREASKRVIGQKHYDVQLMGGIILHRGQIAEMKTGEGKTLVATLPLYLNALTGRGVHLVTVNDYLSRVGAGWMAPVYHSLGLSTSVIIHDQALKYDPEYTDETQFDDRLKHFKVVERKEAYACDITYGTNNEFGFDYLKDNMVSSLEEMVQRDLYFSIVDEVDSILIDEARTPLIISGNVNESTEKYYKFAELVERLKEDEDYNVDEKLRASTLTEEGINKMEKWLGVENIYATGGVRDVHHIEQALKAKALFKKDKDYVVKEGEVIIVDEFTGRLMYGRRYSEGLHQAIEAKEHVDIQKESQTLATITFQNYFRMYEKLAGMTGTALTEAEEFFKIYKLETIVIPTNKPTIRKDGNDTIYANEQAKFKAVIEDIKERKKNGQPVLVGTISIEKNEMLGQMLEYEGIKANILNAKFHDKEAQVIAQAGKFGAVTIATNMAGRGVDIILGGNPFNQEEYDKVVAAGGLHVIGTERHESRRIDNQLRGRAGRQGDPGSSQFYVSMDDDLMRIFGGDRMKGLMKTMRFPEDQPIEHKIISKSIESAQKKVEGNNFDTRKHLVEYDDVINKHRESIYNKRRDILKIADNKIDEVKGEFKSLEEIILDMITNEIEHVVSFHTAAEAVKDWNIDEIHKTISTIFKVEEKLKLEISSIIDESSKLDRIMVRTKLIDHLVSLARDNYKKVSEMSKEFNIDWPMMEKMTLLRSIDTLWIEHLETIDHLRRSIGLRGYAQRDPLVEYKKEAYIMYNELNDLIQKEVAYSIFKIGGLENINIPDLFNQIQKNFIAPAKDMNSSLKVGGVTENNSSLANLFPMGIAKNKEKDEEGNKVGRNDLCPCGSGKKYKKCHGK